MSRILSPALGFALALWWKNRVGLSLILAYLAGLALYVPFAHGPGGGMSELARVLVLILPLFAGMIFLLSIFLPQEADIAAPSGGCYPPHALLLPVRTVELVFWPMAYGALTAGLGWAVIARLILVPVGMPAALIPREAGILVAFLSSLQALSWYPIGLPYLRIFLALLLIPGIMTLGIGGTDMGIPETALTAVLFGVLPLCFGIALHGVARARRGDVRMPGRVWAPEAADDSEAVRRAHPRAKKPFASPAQAQLWFEWKRNGWNLALAVGATCIVLSAYVFVRPGLEPLPAWLPGGLSGVEAGENARIVLYGLLLPPLYAWIVRCGLRKSDTRRRDLTLNPFLAVRPFSSAEWVGCKLRMAAASTLMAWAVLLAFELIWLLWLPAREGGREGPLLGVLLGRLTWRGGAAVMPALLLMGAWTWRNQVEDLAVDFTGRKWVMNGYAAVMACLTMVPFLLPSLYFDAPRLLWTALSYLPWIMGVLLALKLAGVGAALRAVRRQRLLREETAVKLLGAWALAAATLFAAARAVVPESLASRGSLAMGILLFLPLARLLAAPLSLAWNRHR